MSLLSHSTGSIYPPANFLISQFVTDSRYSLYARAWSPCYSIGNKLPLLYINPFNRPFRTLYSLWFTSQYS